MLMRHATISAAVAISLLGAANSVAAGTGMILMDAGQSGFSANVPAWVLAMIAVVAPYSVYREAAISVPPALKAWVGDRGPRLVAASALMVWGAYALG